MLALAEEAAADYPEMRASVRRRARQDVNAVLTEHFVFGLEALLDGLESRLRK